MRFGKKIKRKGARAAKPRMLVAFQASFLLILMAETNAATPSTSVTSAMFAPKTFPAEIPGAFSKIEVIAIESSGKEVATLTSRKPIAISLTFKNFARMTALSTTVSAALAKTNAETSNNANCSNIKIGRGLRINSLFPRFAAAVGRCFRSVLKLSLFLWAL